MMTATSSIFRCYPCTAAALGHTPPALPPLLQLQHVVLLRGERGQSPRHPLEVEVLLRHLLGEGCIFLGQLLDLQLPPPQLIFAVYRAGRVFYSPGCRRGGWSCHPTHPLGRLCCRQQQHLQLAGYPHGLQTPRRIHRSLHALLHSKYDEVKNNNTINGYVGKFKCHSLE